MRKISAVICLILLLFAMTATVSAVTGASGQQNHATVSSDGSCQVSLALTLHLEEAVSKLYFPVPLNASGVSVNGSRVIAGKSDDCRLVNISRYTKNVVGDISLNIQYTLYGVVKETDIGTLELTLPLMNGFDYSVAAFSFTVTLPGQIDTLPSFTSGYHQANIEQDLTYSVDGNTITGSSLKAMKDHETLTMTLVVDKEMFPQVLVETQSTLTATVGMGVCAGLALVYWLLFLRTFPRRTRSSEMPEGCTAGQLGCIVGMAGADLTLTVLSWAQLGYITIRSRKGRVTLHKRMDMGNERSEFERRAFKKLFSTRAAVDTSGMRYAELRQQLSARPAGVGELMHRRTGSNRLFRIFASGIGLFAGGGIGMLLGSGAALQWLLIVLLAALGAVSGWLIQDWTDSTLLRSKEKSLLAVILALGWLLLGIAAENLALAAWFMVGEFIAGILYAIGGRRTELGRQTRAQVLGLKRHLKGGDKEFFGRMQAADPDYFFRMAPCAIALGVGRPFAKAMGSAKLESCSYLDAGSCVPMSAAGWNTLLEQTVSAMDARGKNLPLEKIVKFFKNLRR